MVYNEDQNNDFYDQLPRLGAFEVSLNGVLLYSKLSSKLWPSLSAVSNRLAKVCIDLERGISV